MQPESVGEKDRREEFGGIGDKIMEMGVVTGWNKRKVKL